MIVFLDSNIVIYAVENPPTFGARATARLGASRAAGDSFMVSDLTRMECLVGPLRSADARLEAQFRAFFAAAGVQVVSITAAVCDRAAQVRAAMRFKPMDSLQVAAALTHGADLFLTNDTRLSAFTGLAIEVLP
jgi:predicted nucleic acid-binding protein